MARIPIITSLTESIGRLSTKVSDAAKPHSLGVIISTYNNPTWLEKVLWGYLVQQYDRTPVELLIADDGSDIRTRNLINHYRPHFAWPIKHVWHPDDGFRKCGILNRAIWEAESDYLIFTDHDCIPQSNFLEQNYCNAKRGHFLSGGYFKLPMEPSLRITKDDVETGLIFQTGWLKKELNKTLKPYKLSKTFAPVMNWLTTTAATWNGNSSSCWRDDAVMVNGFNEEMHYGGLDREFGERLVNAGIKPIQQRYTLACLHLDHKRPYADPVLRARNDAIRLEVRQKGIVETRLGIKQHLDEWEAEARKQKEVSGQNLIFAYPSLKKAE